MDYASFITLLKTRYIYFPTPYLDAMTIFRASDKMGLHIESTTLKVSTVQLSIIASAKGRAISPFL